MKKLVLVVLLMAGVILQGASSVLAYDFGDMRSVTLTTKAWEALDKGDIEAVLVYTNKCIELYGEQARKMQAGLKAYATGSNQEIFSYWALNDVSTSLFIQGEAYRKAKMNDEAKEVYKKLMDNYSFGQCWDTKGWFWKPAEAAKEKLKALESGSTVDFGDYTSQTLATKAWAALSSNDLEGVKVYTDKCLELYEGKAKEMQASLTEYPWESKEKIFSYWALNDVGTSLFIKSEALKKAGKNEEAKAAYQRVISEFSFAQCWDPQGWFWKPSDGAQQKIDEMKASE